jgi:hypothetical protein
MRGLSRRIAWLAMALAGVIVSLCWPTGPSAAWGSDPGDAIRRTLGDAMSPENWPAGDWSPVDAAIVDEFLNSRGMKPAAGYLEECEYAARLVEGDTLEGTAAALLRLYGKPALLPLGSPSFAIADGTVDQQQAAWGADAAGQLHVHCLRDRSTVNFQWTQRGLRRGSGIEFPFDGLTATSGRLTLSVPTEKTVVVTGGIVVDKRAADAGMVAHVIEFGSKSRCVVRVDALSSVRPSIVDCELTQSISASTTKLVIQSDFALQPQHAGQFLMDLPVPSGFSVLRVLLASGERIPFERSDSGNGLQILLPDLPIGRNTVCRVVVESPIDWSSFVELPRIVPSNVRRVLEKWTVQFEKPLEVLNVEHPGFIQTGLADEQTREVWSFQGTRPDGVLRVTAGPPPPVLDAQVVIRARRQDSKVELRSAMSLQTRRIRAFGCDVEIRKPWTVVGVEAHRPGRPSRPVTWHVASVQEDSHRVHVDLPQSIGFREPVVLSIVTATPAAGFNDGEAVGAVKPLVAGEVQRWAVATTGDQDIGVADQDGRWLPVQVSDLNGELLTAVGIGEDERTAARAWRRMPSPASPTAAVRPAVAVTPADPTVPIEAGMDAQPPLQADAVMLVETQLAEAGAKEHLTTVNLRFDKNVDASSWSISFDRPISLIDVLGDSRPLEFALDGATLRLPAKLSQVRQLSIRFRQVAVAGWISTSDQVPFPRGPFSVSHWLWRIDVPESRYITAVPDSAVGAAGIRSLSWMRRWFGPLGRRTGETIFNPTDNRPWSQVLEGQAPIRALATERPLASGSKEIVSVFGFACPESIRLESWWASRVNWLSWAALIGSVLTGLAIRRVVRAAYRTASLGVAIAATGALFCPMPWAEIFGACLAGGIGAFLIPRSFVRPAVVESIPPVGSSLILGRTMTTATILIAGSLLLPTGFAASSEDLEILVPIRDEGPESIVLVSNPLREQIAQWERDRQPHEWLIEESRTNVAVEGQETAKVEMRFSILSLSPEKALHVPLPFEGISFRSADAATLDGKPVRLTPTRNSGGIVVMLPQAAGDVRVTEGAGPAYSRFALTLRGQVRLTSLNGATGLAFKLPRAADATVQLQLPSQESNSQIKVACRGHVESTPDGRSFSIGNSGEVAASWRPSQSVSDRSAAEGAAAVSARAESLMVLEPGFLRGRTRLIVESPETSDPFADARLAIVLPPGTTVGRVTGTGVEAWSTEVRDGMTHLTLDLASPPFAQAEFEMEYSFPCGSGLAMEIPALELLREGRVRSHQVALATSEPFQLRILTAPNPELGIWEVAPNETAFTLRRDAGLPMPDAGLELEYPQPLNVELRQLDVSRVAEVEQTLRSTRENVHWEGHVRIETSGRAALLHEFDVDPRVQVDSVSVVQNDVDRLLRYTRQNGRLLLFLRDDRPGTQIVRMSGTLVPPPREWTASPTLVLRESRTMRSELILQPGGDGQIESRLSPTDSEKNAGEVVAGPDAEQRFSLDGAGAGREFRWVPAKAALVAEQLVRIDSASELTAEWALAGDAAALSELEIDVPETAIQVEVTGDYTQSVRRTYPHGGLRIGLIRTTPSNATATLVLKVRARDAAVFHQSLPRLVGKESLGVKSWLVAPRDFVEQLDVVGEPAADLPASVPDSWKTGLRTGEAVAFRVQSWRMRSPESLVREPLGTCDVSTLLAVDGVSAEGLTSIIASPSRTGTLTIVPPTGGRIMTVWLDDRRIQAQLKDGLLANVAVLRPRNPVTVVVRWTTPITKSTAARVPPRLPSLERFQVSQSTVAMLPGGVWLAGGGPVRDRSIAVEYARRRADALLAVVEAAPSGAPIPSSVSADLRSTAKMLSMDGLGAAQVSRIEATLNVLATQNAASAVKGVASANPTDSDVTAGLTESLLAEAMRSREATILIGADSPGPVMLPRKAVLWIAAVLWFVGSLIILRRALKLATRWRVADRLADHAAVALFGIGLAWWLFLSPSVLGLLLCGMVAASRLLPRRVRDAVARTSA